MKHSVVGSDYEAMCAFMIFTSRENDLKNSQVRGPCTAHTL